jgi:hypothetical protein
MDWCVYADAILDILVQEAAVFLLQPDYLSNSGDQGSITCL